jgi:Na+-translocating ferredoxin:NAD+ oxidoreductase RnfC subunit
MRQHIGMPASPVVKAGDRVRVGDLVGEIVTGGMGAPVHASIDGVVRAVSFESVVIEAD